MNTVAHLTLTALAEAGTRLEGYTDCLIKSCGSTPPPYGKSWYGDRYREVSSDPEWLAHSLVANAQKEGEGARKLWDLSGRTGDLATREAIRRHAVDESRHALLYLKMLDLVFPDAVSPDLRSSLQELSPHYRFQDKPEVVLPSHSDDVLDEVIQMNIGEIRTRIHQLLLRPVITAYCSHESQKKLLRILDSLLLDETKHIDYTANLIEVAANTGKKGFVLKTMTRRIEEFNQITLRELGVDQFIGD